MWHAAVWFVKSNMVEKSHVGTQRHDPPWSSLLLSLSSLSMQSTSKQWHWWLGLITFSPSLMTQSAKTTAFCFSSPQHFECFIDHTACHEATQMFQKTEIKWLFFFNPFVPRSVQSQKISMVNSTLFLSSSVCTASSIIPILCWPLPWRLKWSERCEAQTRKPWRSWQSHGPQVIWRVWTKESWCGCNAVKFCEVVLATTTTKQGKNEIKQHET